MTAEHAEYEHHLRECGAAGRGGWCEECRHLLWDADVADAREAAAQLRAERSAAVS